MVFVVLLLSTFVTQPPQGPVPPQGPPVVAAPPPLGTPPGKDFQWRYLPGIGWGWVQDGVTLPPAAATAPKLKTVVGPAPGPACDT